MGNKYIEIGGQSYPANLGILLKEADPKDYEVKRVYYLDLFNGKKGFYPAVISDDKHPKRIVLTTDRDLISEVSSKLPQNNFKTKALLLQVHSNNKIGYKLNLKEEDSLPMLLMDREEFEFLLAEKENPFEWSTGLMYGFKSVERLVETVDSYT